LKLKLKLILKRCETKFNKKAVTEIMPKTEIPLQLVGMLIY